MDQPVRPRRRALVASTAIAVAAVLATTGLAWGAGDVSPAGVVSRAGDVGRAGVTADQTTPATTSLGGFVAVEPVRILDTRQPANGPIGVSTAAPLMGGEQIDLPVTRPAPNARSMPLPSETTAVLINVTIDGDATERSYLTVWPEGTPRPFASADNAEPGLVTPNLTLAKLGPDGGISIYAQQGAINFAIDLVGYTLPLPEPEIPNSAGTMLIGTGLPTADTGTTGAFDYDSATDQLYGPKGADGSLARSARPAGVGVARGGVPGHRRLGRHLGRRTRRPRLRLRPPGGGLERERPERRRPTTCWTPSVAVRPSVVPMPDATIQCAWSNRPGRLFTLRLPLSSATDPNEVTGSIAVPGSITDGITADLACRAGSVAALGGTIEVQAVQVTAHRVNLLDNT